MRRSFLHETNDQLVNVWDKEIVIEGLSLPSNSSNLSKAEVVKMLYLASGWIGEKLKDRKSENIIDGIALMIHDSDDIEESKKKNIDEGEVVSLKPKLKAKKTSEQKPDFKKAEVDVNRSNGYGDRQYYLNVRMPVSKDFLQDKKRGPGEFTKLLHDFLGDRFGNWFGHPTIGGLSNRAKDGMVMLNASFPLSAMDAYGYGMDLNGYGSSPVVKDKSEYEKRVKFAQAAVAELQDFKKNATDEMDKKGITSKEDRDRIWKEEYMSDFVKLSNAYKDKGISYVELAMRR